MKLNGTSFRVRINGKDIPKEYANTLRANKKGRFYEVEFFPTSKSGHVINGSTPALIELSALQKFIDMFETEAEVEILKDDKVIFGKGKKAICKELVITFVCEEAVTGKMILEVK